MNFSKLYIFRITHINNIEHIIENGITHRNSTRQNPNYVTIGDSSLISTRSSKIIPNGTSIGDYIPFYFGFRSPMLFVIQRGYNNVPIQRPTNIVYCVSSIQEIISSKIDFLYTDGHATDTFTTFYEPDQINDIENQLDFDAIQAKFWNDENDLDLKRRKEAELLLSSDLPVDRILGYIVYSEYTKKELVKKGINEQIIAVRPNYYFEQ